jgi:hypothetical protein
MAPTPESDAVEEETVNSTILYCADTQSNVGFVLCRDEGLPTCKTQRNMNQMHLDHRDKIQLDAKEAIIPARCLRLQTGSGH